MKIRSSIEGTLRARYDCVEISAERLSEALRLMADAVDSVELDSGGCVIHVSVNQEFEPAALVTGYVWVAEAYKRTPLEELIPSDIRLR